MTTTEDKNIPSTRGQRFIQIQLIYSLPFVTDDDEKMLDRIFNTVGPGLRGGRFWKRVVVLLIIRFSCCLVFLKWDSDEGGQSLSFVVKF